MMGSGSSKSNQAVANVNKRSENRKSTATDSENGSGKVLAVSNSTKIDKNNLKNKDSKETDTKKRTKEKDSKNYYKNELQFEEDSDADIDLDEVLKIPVAVDRKKEKDKKHKKQMDKENEYDHGAQTLSQELPETYAQRLQRKQYKLQQDLLIREKTIVRNPKDWEDSDNEQSNDYHDNENVSPSRGFDASKFRAVNKKDTTREFFAPAAVQDDFKTPRYLQSSGQTLDDVDLPQTESVPSYKQPPKYDESELDLMRQLEEELLYEN